MAENEKETKAPLTQAANRAMMRAESMQSGKLCGKQKEFGRKNPYARQSRDAERNKSSEAGGLAVKKSRYCSSCTRTANRHRWMRRES